MLSILRKHLRWNMSSLSSSLLVIRHSSAQYISTDITLVLKSFNLVLILYLDDFQILFSGLTAVLASPNRLVMSASVPPVLSIVAPRYRKDSVSSTSLLSILILSLFLQFILIVIFLGFLTNEDILLFLAFRGAFFAK